MATNADSWFPLFEFQDWNYQSFLVLPTSEESAGSAGTPITAKKWAKGTLKCGQAFSSPNGYTLEGVLEFGTGAQLSVSAKGTLGNGDGPGTFEATGTGVEGRTKGAVYQLVGWVFPEKSDNPGAARVLSVRGSVRAVRGPDAAPELELGRMPLGTVGTFVIEKPR